MDLVYICRDGNNEELRYSIRSVVKNLPHDNIWVVGGKPEWYSGNFIEGNPTKNSYKNARINLDIVCNDKRISDDFILMNDDFFIVKHVSEITPKYRGTLWERINNKNLNLYENLLRETYIGLTRRYKINNPLDYELHIPMIMNKEKLKPLLKYSGLWRSLYGNIYRIGGDHSSDVKVYVNKDRQSYEYNDQSIFLSTEDESFDQIKDTVLDKMFPNPSIYESPR